MVSKSISVYILNIYKAALKNNEDLMVSRTYWISPTVKKTMPANQYILSIISVGAVSGGKYCSSMYELGPDGYCEVWDRQ